ncbi:MAG: tRNA-dihydrouridine synthase family protein [Bdellovibrionota bacterium]
MNDVFSKHGFKSPVLMLAPMEGITNHLFRNLFIKNPGVDFVATEFIRITTSRQKLKPFNRHSVPLQIQVMSARPEELQACIEFLKNRKVLLDDDWLDLNVGCPSKRVNASGAGAALLLEPNKLVDMAKRMREVHPGPLSIKTRVGYQSDENYSTILDALATCPIDFVSIHARTKCAGYTSPVNLKYLKQAVARLPFPVIGNGDIWTVNDALQMLEETGVRGLMCGRGAVSNPFLMTEISASIQGQSFKVSHEKLVEFFFELLKTYQLADGDKPKRLGVFKEFTTWFCRHPLVGKELFQRIKRKAAYADIYDAAMEYFYLANQIETKSAQIRLAY